MKIYIAGIMQGSNTGHGIQSQDYRMMIQEAVEVNHPDAEIVDPFSIYPDSVNYDDQRAKQVLFALVEEAGSSDILIAYLPKASMGTALEMIRAYDNGGTIISITPMEKNWVINAVSSKIFRSLDEFCDWIRQAQFSDFVDSPPS